MVQEEFKEITDLKEGNIIRAKLPSLEYDGLLYVVGYSFNPFAKRSDLMFFGIREGDEELYYINLKKLSIVNNILIEKERLNNFPESSLENFVAGGIDRENAQRNLEGLDISIFPAEISSDPLYKKASVELRSIA